jgi:hypothetical protein
MVWRWWDEQALELLQGRRGAVDVGMAHAAIADLRDQFTRGMLPTLIELDDIDIGAVTAEFESSTFVQQMRWLAYPPRNLQRAVTDFYRAKTQTIRWLEEDLLVEKELRTLGDEIKEEWEIEFEWMLEDLGSIADEPSKQRAGTKLLRELSRRTGPCLRNRCHDDFFTRGQRHMLADEGKVGWHPDFQQRLPRNLADSP